MGRALEKRVWTLLQIGELSDDGWRTGTRRETLAGGVSGRLGGGGEVRVPCYRSLDTPKGPNGSGLTCSEAGGEDCFQGTARWERRRLRV